MAASKKWWWLAGVAVPIAVAVVAIVPDLLQERAGGEADTFRVIGTQFNDEVTFNSVTIVVEQARRAGRELPDSVVETLREALNLAQAGQFDAAIPLLESVADAAPVPALLNNLGAAYLATGDRERAEEYFDQALARSPEEPSADISLSELTRGGTDLNICCDIVTNPELLGVSGRVVVDALEGVSDFRVQVFEAGTDQRVRNWYGNASVDLLPGDYAVVLNGVLVTGVRVNRQMDTTIRSGALTINLSDGSRWMVFDEAQETRFTDNYGTGTIALPVGVYAVSMAGGWLRIEIVEGEVTTL